jgi:hypothetical protein
MATTSLRRLIRHAVVKALQADAGLAALLGGRIFANRVEHWLPGDLPAAGVYTLSEEPLESDISPAPRERRISLVIELLARMSAKVDDALDGLAQAVEDALQLDAIGAAMTALVNEQRAAAGQESLPPVTTGGIPRSSAVDTLLALKLTGIDVGIAVEGDRHIGVAALAYDLEYVLPKDAPREEFLAGVSGWDVVECDGSIDMESRWERP